MPRTAHLLALAGGTGTAGGRLLRFVSIEQVGAAIAVALINLNPLIASGLAILPLGERVTAPMLAGRVVIVVGTTLLSAGGLRIGFRPASSRSSSCRPRSSAGRPSCASSAWTIRDQLRARPST